jgi:dolichol-phosphate mannosyltransferase
MQTLVVSPTYLEAENIEEFLRRVRAAVPDADVLIVDDNSADGTADLAEKLGAELGNIEVLRRPAKAGLGAAYRAGFALGLERGYDALCEIDADLSHDPAALPSLIDPVLAGEADLVIGSRYVPGGSVPNWTWARRALSRGGNLYAGIMLGTGVRDMTAGYRVYRATTLVDIDYASTTSKGYGFQIENTYRVWKLGLRIVELPIQFTDRTRGHSKMTWSVAAEGLALVTWWAIRDRSRRLLRAARRDRRPG